MVEEEKEIIPEIGGEEIEYKVDTNTDPNPEANSTTPSSDPIPADFALTPNKQLFDVRIEVGEPVFTDKHHEYPIAGRDEEGPFEIMRRFNEFIILRETMIKRWPAIYIPELPPKKALGNKEDAFVQERRAFLQLFLTKLSNYTFLFISDEVKLFLRGAGDFKKLVGSVNAKVSTEEMLSKYSIAFKINEANLNKSKELDSVRLEEHNTHLQTMIPELEKLQKLCSDSKESTKQQNVLYGTFVLECSKYEKGNILEYANKDPHKMILGNPMNDSNLKAVESKNEEVMQPFVAIENWIKEEMMELKAVQSTMEGLQSLKQQRNKIKEKKAALEVSLGKLTQGKSGGLKTMFGGSKDKEISNLNTQIPNMVKEIENMNGVINICTNYLGKHFLPQFQSKQLKNYYSAIKAFADSQHQVAEKIAKAWSSFLNDENLKHQAKT